MRDRLSLISPRGSTSRSHYWLIILASVLVLLAAACAKNIVGAAASLALVIVVQLIDLIATTRRLHDAGWSRWWLALYLFPMSITWDLMHVQIGASTWHLVDLAAVIRLIPVFIGLLAAQNKKGAGIASDALVRA